MKTIFKLLLLCSLFVANDLYSQSNFEDCSSFSATYTTTESRCASTGSITVTASGGSGNYNYKVTGPVSTPITSSPVISALSPGNYTLTIKDITKGCVLTIDNINIAGTYIDPRFELSKTDASCTNGNNATISVINQANGRFPFTYRIIAPSPSGIGTTNNTGVFTNLSPGEYYVQQKDSCGGIQTRSIVISNYTWSIYSNTVTKSNCNTITVTMNLSGNSGSTNNWGSAFSGFTYGYVINPGDTTWFTTKSFTLTRSPLRSVVLVAKDRCGLVQSLAWTNPQPSFSSSIRSSNHACSTFTATAQGLSNLTNPQFCLKQGTTTISCNNTGQFDNIPYGSYCLEMYDACYDTTITYCFTKSRRKPSVDADATISDMTCTSFTAAITGQSYLFNPLYCLYDNNNSLVNCNTTGLFTGLAYNSYCIKITSAAPCYDTVITRCFSVTRPVPLVADPSVSNRTCSAFDVSIPSVSNINSPYYCLNDSLGNVISCNSTGIFTNILYGSYCITITDANPGTGCTAVSINKCFTTRKRTPSVSSAVTITDKQCTVFSASVTNVRNFNNPQFCLYNNSNTLVSCNATGTFTDIPYGSYCMKIMNGCNDTTITRCFSASVDPVSVSASAAQSCIIGKTNITVTVWTGRAPYTAKILNPGNITIADAGFSTSTYTFTGVATMPAGNQYKVVVTDNCGATDTTLITPVASQFDRVVTTTGKCPSAQNQNGSGDIRVIVTSNIGSTTPVIIFKNGGSTAISYSSAISESANSMQYTFNDLVPATYIIGYTITSCGKSVYDTVTISNYKYPNLLNSAVYQCDNNGFSVNAVAAGGVAPYSYEIIGSYPSAPAITTGPQSSPIFNINTGSSYSLVRLRVVDGCGNGSLNDVGVLPLNNISIISNNYDCYYNNITLSTDTIPNASYTWYKKANATATDSTVIGSSLNYNLPYLLPTDTGVYIVKASVNTGCLTRLAYFSINADCGGSINVLPVKLVSFTGKADNKKTELNFSVTSEAGLQGYIVQRKNSTTNKYEDLGIIKSLNVREEHSYSFTDYNPYTGINEYRLLLRSTNGESEFSKIVQVSFNESSIVSAMPNPVSEVLNIQFRNHNDANYEITLFTANGQRVYLEKTGKISNKTIQVKRNASMINGVYFLAILNTTDGTTHNEKLIFNR